LLSVGECDDDGTDQREIFHTNPDCTHTHRLVYRQSSSLSLYLSLLIYHYLASEYRIRHWLSIRDNMVDQSTAGSTSLETDIFVYGVCHGEEEREREREIEREVR